MLGGAGLEYWKKKLSELEEELKSNPDNRELLKKISKAKKKIQEKSVDTIHNDDEVQIEQQMQKPLAKSLELFEQVTHDQKYKKNKSSEKTEKLVDISGFAHFDIKNRIKKEIVSKYIKSVDKENVIHFDKYIHKDEFSLVANILIDNDMKQDNKKARQTVIKFDPVIDKKNWNKKSEYLYIIVINDYIVKIGGTRDGLKQRTGSYLCGHYTSQRGKSGKASVTNMFIYNTLDFYLRLGCEAKLFAKELPTSYKKIVAFDTKYSYCKAIKNIVVQTYHGYESIYIEDYKKHNKGIPPPFSFNADPNYKKKSI